MPFAGQCVRAALGTIMVALALALPGCTGKNDAWTYSVEDVRAAFREAGYPLRKVVPPGGAQLIPPAGVHFPASEGTYLEPQSGGPPWVLIASPANVDDSWTNFVKVGGDADSLTMRRANVLFISDGGMSRLAKARARRAMNDLPNRGYETEVLERT